MKDVTLAVLAEDYTSPLLLNTLMKLSIPVLALSDGLKADLSLHCRGLKIADMETARRIISDPDGRILANSDLALLSITMSPSDPSRSEAISIFRDKPLFRRQVAGIFPDFFFVEVAGGSLGDLELPSGRDYVIKPSVGKIGLRFVKGGEDIQGKAAEILEEAGEASLSLGPGAISQDRFTVEEHISGEEVSCDAYFNSKGEPVVLGVYTHPHKGDDDVSDVLYCTSKEIISRLAPRICDLLRKASKGLFLRNFPLHAQFRLKRNRLLPIEINPMRFGCFGLSDLPFIAFGVNPYKAFFNDDSPDWKKVLLEAGDETYFMVRAVIPPSARGRPADHEKYAASFDDLMGYCKLDTSMYPAFSIAFGRARDQKGAMKHLGLDFESYLS